jgi:hypothetical protein
MGSEPKRERILKPRHAAALALVGWYLIWPPSKDKIDPHCSGQHLSASEKKTCDAEALEITYDAPLRRWEPGIIFNKLSVCETYAVSYRRSNPVYQPKCIEENDPRLKGK